MKAIKYSDFELSEYQSRIQRLQTAMAEAGLDALVVTDPSNLRYLFGFQNLLQLSATRLFVGLFPREEPDQATLFLPHDCLDAPQSWVENVTFWSEGQEPPFDDRKVDIGMVAQRIDSLGLKGGRIGLELGLGTRPGMPAQQFDRLRALLSKADVVDASEVWWSLRQVKSEAEIEVLRCVAAISLKAINRGLDSLREGITEKELCREIHATMFKEGADGQGFLGVLFGVEGWRRANMAPTDERRLQKDEWVSLDGGGVLQGYWGDICRMGVLGEATKEQMAIFEAVQEAQKAMIAVIRPRVPCSEIYRTGRDVLERKGWARQSGPCLWATVSG